MTNLRLPELLAIAAHKARSNMGEGRAHVAFQELLEAAAAFSEAHWHGDEAAMFSAADTVRNRADDFASEVKEPDAPDAGWAEESCVFQSARAL